MIMRLLLKIPPVRWAIYRALAFYFRDFGE